MLWTKKMQRCKKKLSDVARWYVNVINVKVEDVKMVYDMTRNTLIHNLDGLHDIKVDHVFKIQEGIFPDGEASISPEIPKEAIKFLDPNEMDARMFAACLDDDPEKVNAVAALMVKLVNHELPPLPKLKLPAKKKGADK